MKEKVAYIVVSYNNEAILDECFQSIIEQDYESKIIICVDNDSKDSSVGLVGKNFPDVIMLPQDTNHGFAKGNNIGIEYALQDPEVQYIVLLNSDARLAEDWTSTIVNFAKLKPKGASFQTITLDYYDHNIIDSTHIFVAPNSQATQGSWRRPLPVNSDVAPQKTYGCNAASVLYTRKFIEEQPYDTFFDETMFMYLEDVDIATRATVMGWDNYVVSGTRSYHMGSASSGKNPGFSLYMTYRNNIGLIVKNYSWPIIIKMIPKLVYSDYLTIKHLIFGQHKRRAALKLVQGRLAGLLYVPVYVSKRRALKPYIKSTSELVSRYMVRGF